MQKGPSQVSAGNISPAVMGPQKDTKDIVILSSLVLILAGLSAVAWIYTETKDPKALTAPSDKVVSANVSEILKKASGLSQAEASISSSTPVTAPAATVADIIHSDVYFEVSRKGLTDEAKAQPPPARPLNGPPALRPVSSSSAAACRSPRACSTGASPKRTPAASATPNVKASTPPSSAISFIRGSAPGAAATKARRPAQARARPSRAPHPASRTLSVKS